VTGRGKKKLPLFLRIRLEGPDTSGGGRAWPTFEDGKDLLIRRSAERRNRTTCGISGATSRKSILDAESSGGKGGGWEEKKIIKCWTSI